MRRMLSRLILCFMVGLALAAPGAAIKLCGLCKPSDPPGLSCLCLAPEGSYPSTCGIGCLLDLPSLETSSSSPVCKGSQAVAQSTCGCSVVGAPCTCPGCSYRGECSIGPGGSPLCVTPCIDSPGSRLATP